MNALLAEHLLSNIELGPRNPHAKILADAMLAAGKSRARKTFDPARFTEPFNVALRFTQLNLIATGLQQLGRAQQGASWGRVRKPFAPLDNPNMIEKAHGMLFFNTGIDVRIKSGSFKLMDWGVCDLRLSKPQEAH